MENNYQYMLLILHNGDQKKKEEVLKGNQRTACLHMASAATVFPYQSWMLPCEHKQTKGQI